MISVTYSVAGKPVTVPMTTPFVEVALRIGWRHLVRALARREPLDVQVTVTADPDTMASVQDVLDCHPADDPLVNAAESVQRAKARLVAAQAHMDRQLDAVTL